MGIENLILPEYKTIRAEIIQKLLEQIGIVKTSMLIKEELYNKTDYIAMKDEIFNNENIEELYMKIKSKNL